MIDFNEEINKYAPVMEMEDVESAVRSDEVRDIMDLMQYIISRIDTERE